MEKTALHIGQIIMIWVLLACSGGNSNRGSDGGGGGNGANDSLDGSAGEAGVGGDAGGGSGGTGSIGGTGGMAGMSGVGGGMSMEIDDAIDVQGVFTPDPMLTVEVAAPSGEPTEDRCGAVHYWERTARFTNIGVESTHGSELFPGNVVNGDDALNGQLNRINAPLAPVTFSVSLQNTDTVTGDLPKPSLSTFRTELNRLLTGAMSAVAPAQVAFRVASVTSSSDLSNALGGSVSFFGLFNFSNQLNFSSSTYKSRFVVSFDQTYYTVDTEPKDRPSNAFASGAMPTFDSPPLYVKSIRYGRRVFLFVKSTHYEQGTREVLNAGFSDAMSGVSFGANFDNSQSTTFDEMEISAVVVGGSASNAVQLATGDISALQTLLNDGAEFSPTNPGAPIDFQLAYLIDNSTADISVTSSYVTHSCVDIDLTTTLIDACGDTGDCANGEFFGPIDVWVTEDPNDPCGVKRGSVLGNAGAAWSGAPADIRTLLQIQVPSGTDRPVCTIGHLYEEDVFSNDDYGPVYLEFTLPAPPMTFVEGELPLSDPGYDDLTYHSRIDVLGTSPIPLN